MLLFHPKAYDASRYDQATRRALLAVRDFFESKGHAALKEETVDEEDDTGMKEELKRLADKEFRESEEVFSQTAEYLRKGFSHFDTLTKIGDPTDEILQTAYELNPDIIALGSKGMGGFRGVIGSISRYILCVAECSVLIGKT